MYNRRKGAIAIVLMLFIVLSVASVQPSRAAHFVFSGWTYPDQHGQGIDGFLIYENSTGSWLNYWASYGYYVEGDTFQLDIFNCNESIFIKLIFTIVLNNTLVGASNLADGKNYLRLNISVVDRSHFEVFSKANFTYVDGVDWGDGYLWYEYEVILDFPPLAGQYYVCTVSYEVFYAW